MKPPWLAFRGHLVREEAEVVTLGTPQGNAQLDVRLEDLQRDGDRILVRRGATVQVTRNPTDHFKPADVRVDRAECPSGNTKCVGNLLICCESGKVIGSCVGVWNDCP